ncbi:SDR family oxidoreductase [Brevibacterium sp. CFH 10365]|uniref:SDR family oxidoreductase n=1 Tax=Brevibacterium sp. CFH 10365 TaxID=2585207 RepID=UPI0012666706|nr:SDR family oxidoreductase [Brevibacterium sp. CFH 10365]
MGETAVIIGVGGMGEAIARRVGSGRDVLLADSNPAALDRIATALSDDGYSVTTQRVDVSDRDSVIELAGRAGSLGSVAHVAHTAGLSPEQADVAAVLDVDLISVANSLDEFGAVIAPGGSGVVISSMAGWLVAGRMSAEEETALALTPTAELLSLPMLRGLSDSGAAYGIAKRANQLRVSAASPIWGRRGGRINSISPGVISTPMGQQELSGESGEAMRAMIDGSGTGRIGTPSDIAAAAAFLLGPETSFITGADLLVDGGVVGSVRGGVSVPGDES